MPAFCLLNIRVGGHKALAEVIAEFIDAKRAAGREEYQRVQSSALGLFLFQGARLSVARRIVVEQHHGTINVVSRPGDTRFRVYLPPESRMNARRALEHLLGAKTSTIAPLTETIRAPPGSRLNRRLPH